MEFMQFLYEPMKIRFRRNLYEPMKLSKFVMKHVKMNIP
jgi:hypothetical protein